MIKILMTFDEAYAPHAAAVITGLIRYSSVPLAFAVMHRGISEHCIKRFVDYYHKKNIHIDFIKVDFPHEIMEIIDNIESQEHLKGKYDSYLRLLAPEYIEDDEVIYLDCDIVVNGDIALMMDEINRSKLLCAVKEHDPLHKLRSFASIDDYQYPASLEEYIIRDAFFYRLKNYYKMNMSSPYFCAGIMFMNLKKWREERLLEKIITKMRETKLFISADQDVLNSVIDGDFGVLSPKWNSFVVQQGIMLNYTSSELKEAIENPIIVHMPGASKPWNKNLGGKYRRQYWDFRLDTPWPESYSFPITKRCFSVLKSSCKIVIKQILVTLRLCPERHSKNGFSSSIFADAYTHLK